MWTALTASWPPNVIRKSVKIEIEVDDLDQFRKVIDVRPDIILLDNMDVETMEMAVKINDGRAILEASEFWSIILFDKDI